MTGKTVYGRGFVREEDQNALARVSAPSQRVHCYV